MILKGMDDPVKKRIKGNTETVATHYDSDPCIWIFTVIGRAMDEAICYTWL